MYVVFVTGGLASGKRTACEFMADHGATLLDLDAIAKEEQENPLILTALMEEFGDDLVNREGELNRRLLAERAFASPERGRKLNEICWPPVIERVADLLIGGSCQPRLNSDFIVVEIPLLVESSKLIEMADEIITVEVDENIRLQRAVERGMDTEDAINRMALQATDDERRKIATHVFDNNGTREELKQQVDDWYSHLRTERMF